MTAVTAAAAERRLATALSSLLAIAAGVLTVAAYAPFGAPGLAVVTLALLFGLWFADESPRAAARTGLAFGIGLFGAGVSWVYIALETFGGMAPPLAALATGGLVLFLSLYPALAGFVAVRLTPAGTTRRAIAGAAAFVLAEWLRGFLFTGFPWLAVGYSQLPGSPLAGYAPVGGVWLVSLAVALVAALLVVAIDAFVDGRRRAGALAAAGVLVLGAGGARSPGSSGRYPPAIRWRSRWCRATCSSRSSSTRRSAIAPTISTWRLRNRAAGASSYCRRARSRCRPTGCGRTCRSASRTSRERAAATCCSACS